MNSNTKKSTQAKRVSVSFESQQETAIMSLLAYFGVKFCVSPPRKSCSNCQFFDIETIEINNHTFDFKAFIEHYIVANNKQLSPTAAHYGKYQKRNMTAATNNVLTDMLKSIGWKISFKNSKEATITLKMERINVLSFGGVVINGEDIALFGEKLNMGLKGVVSQKRDAPLVIGKEELPIYKMVDLSSIPSVVDLSPIVKMLQPISVSQQIGNNVCCDDENVVNTLNSFNMNNFNSFNNVNNESNMNRLQMNEYLMNANYGNYTYENEERRNDIQQYVVECSKILDGQNQSQNASQSIAGTIANSEISANAQMFWNNGMMYGQCSPCVCATPLAANALLAANGADNKDELRRERSTMNSVDINNNINNININNLNNMNNVNTMNQFTQFTQFDDKKDINDKYDNELPPATNAEDTMQHNEMNIHHSPNASNVQMVVDSQVVGDDGQVYVLTYLPCYGWCYLPCTSTIDSATPTQNMNMNMNTMNMNMNNAMVEGVEEEEGEEEEGVFMNMANYSNVV